MSAPVIHALGKLRDAMNEFCDALEAEVAGRWKTPLPTGLTPPTARGQKAMAKAAPRVVLPTPLVKARNGEPELSEETRAASMVEATAIVGKMRALGIPQVQWAQGLRGELAKERIPFDERLLADALADSPGV
jgi:hypothetical protein